MILSPRDFHMRNFCHSCFSLSVNQIIQTLMQIILIFHLSLSAPNSIIEEVIQNVQRILSQSEMWCARLVLFQCFNFYFQKCFEMLMMLNTYVIAWFLKPKRTFCIYSMYPILVRQGSAYYPHKTQWDPISVRTGRMPVSIRTRIRFFSILRTVGSAPKSEPSAD
jgi:hypothetical protein